MIDPELWREGIVAILIVLVYLVKRSMEKGLDGINTSLTTINSNITKIQINIHLPQKIDAKAVAAALVELNEQPPP